MAYLGREPNNGFYEKQTLSCDGSTTTFTLNFAVGSTSSILVQIDGVLQEKTYLRKIYGNEKFSAILLTTASGVCSVLKIFLDGKLNSKGFTKQESLSWKDFLDNKFGEVYS